MKRGARRRLDELVRERGGRAFQYAYHLSGSTDEARDLVQEAFLRALCSWKKYDPSRPFRSWLHAILRNLYLDKKKRAGRQHVSSLDEARRRNGSYRHKRYGLPRWAEEDALCKLERKERLSMVEAALADLSPDHRRVLSLCHIERLKYSQAAQALGIPIGTVRSRVHRAKMSLRRGLSLRGVSA
ncbi:RNA polymerase sigma factor [Elusimicrobiota bacterium]